MDNIHLLWFGASAVGQHGCTLRPVSTRRIRSFTDPLRAKNPSGFGFAYFSETLVRPGAHCKTAFGGGSSEAGALHRQNPAAKRIRVGFITARTKPAAVLLTRGQLKKEGQCCR
jgi:hypothetical protein